MLYIKFEKLSVNWFQRRFLKDFYHVWAQQQYWLHDPDHLNKLSFPHPTEAPCEIWLWLAQWFLRRSSKSVDDGQMPTDDGACLYYKLTYEPKESGELKLTMSRSMIKPTKPCVLSAWSVFAWCPVGIRGPKAFSGIQQRLLSRMWVFAGCLYDFVGRHFMLRLQWTVTAHYAIVFSSTIHKININDSLNEYSWHFSSLNINQKQLLQSDCNEIKADSNFQFHSQ